MRKRREINMFSISFLDLLSGALGAVIILYVAIPKNKVTIQDPVEVMVKEDLRNTQMELKAVREKLKELESKSIVESPGGKDVDIGFKFKGKEILFLIDTSYSMTKEDRMGQVKAGLKMLFTALPSDYQVEVVQFPLGERAPFKSLFGTLREAGPINKAEVYEFIYSLRPNGGTPTRDALKFVLQNYENLTDIVILTDGAPTLHNSNQKDDIHDILKMARQENTHKVRINAIGVGADFVRDHSSDRYQFLKLLSEQTDGFFVGF